MKKAICANCLGLLVHKLPVTRGARAFLAGAVGFISAFFEDKPEKCDGCGLLAPRCFHYDADEETVWCVHCGVDREHHEHAGHEFLARTVGEVVDASKGEQANG